MPSWNAAQDCGKRRGPDQLGGGVCRPIDCSVERTIAAAIGGLVHRRLHEHAEHLLRVAGPVYGAKQDLLALDGPRGLGVPFPFRSALMVGDDPALDHLDLNRDLYDEVRSIPEEEARAMCHQLAREEGLLVGTSTGLNVTAAIRMAKELGPGRTVVTVASDTGLKYMNGKLFADA